MRRCIGPLGRAQFCGARARIGGRLLLVRDQRPLGQHLEAWGAWRTSGWCRDPPPTRERSARNVLTIRSSSEWNETTTSRPPGFRISFGRPQRLLQLIELFVDEDAQRLERPRRGMDFARPLAQHARDDLDQRPRRRDRRPVRASAIARAIGRANFSSPRTVMMRARSAGAAAAITSAALGPSPPMRMSSGPSRRNEKPRSA